MKFIIQYLTFTVSVILFNNNNFMYAGQNSMQYSNTKNEISIPSKPNSSAVIPSINEIISSYLQMKNALADDNPGDAAAAGKILEAAFKNFDKVSMSHVQKKIYQDVEEDAREHSEHIGANRNKIFTISLKHLHKYVYQILQ